VEALSYDAHGKRRLPTWEDVAGQLEGIETKRSFTGHEFLDDVSIIHMNGRVYDPSIGRFASADIVVQLPENLQSYNRYSYVFNNPLSLIDPTGYEGEGVLEEVVVTGTGPGSTTGMSTWEYAVDTVSFFDDMANSIIEGLVNDYIDRTLNSMDEETAATLVQVIDSAVLVVEVIDGITTVVSIGVIVGTGGVGVLFAVPMKLAVKLGKAGITRILKKFRQKIVGKFGKKLNKRDSPCCFVAGTQVLTDQGHRNIEDVQTGDLVWSKDTATGEQSYKPVIKLFVRNDRQIYQLLVKTNDAEQVEVEATDDHPFYVVGTGWKRTLELAPGDQIETDGHGVVTVESVIDEERIAPTYNFTIEDFHTYYVTEKNLLVHNDNCATKRPGSFRKKTVKDSWDNAADGTKSGTKKCPTCDNDVSGNPYNGEKRNGSDGWDNDHQPKWKDRDLNGMDRKQVLDEYNKDTRLRCPGCNRADNQ
jgi:RHS repeat-associated protein